ncbi:M23 family metallopeptidase [Streptomyces sp. NPDC003247]|uniref:M23 family metallopeptidase n=1 Tax=Streptomyces sp. NPDC003247 TaxID=3364677 RepID=UPI003688A11C
MRREDPAHPLPPCLDDTTDSGCAATTDAVTGATTDAVTGATADAVAEVTTVSADRAPADTAARLRADADTTAGVPGVPGSPAGTTVGVPAGAAVLAVLLAAALVALAAMPADAGSDGVRERAARVVHDHEQARERVDRLRRTDAGTTKVKAAESRRKTLRDDLWDLLGPAAHDNGDPVAVDPAGRAGHCAVPDPAPAPDRTPERDRDRDRDRDREKEKGGKEEGDRAEWTAPTRGYWLSAGYADKGSRWAHRHTGQDFAVPAGTPVYAVGPGVVRVTTCGDGFGNQVVVRHADGYFTQYAHLSRTDVRKGERVGAGQRLGLAGATGNVTGPHLHFEVRITPYMGSAVPPLPWLRRKAVRVTPPEQPGTD